MSYCSESIVNSNRLGGAGVWLPSVSMAALSIALACPGAARAAEDQAPDNPVASDAVQPSEIVVTARRRDEALQEVPLSVTLISGDTLREQGAINTREVLSTVPNLTVSTGSRGGRDAVIKIRGVATADTTPVFDPGVGIYINEVYIGRTAGALTDLMDLESVQVLRGPQGTLFGRNSVGGAVLITTKRPTDRFEGEAGVRIGNYDGFGFHGILNVPIANDWAVRGVYQQYDRDGYGRNLFTGFENLNNAKNKLWRVSLQGNLSDDIELFVSYDGVDERSNGRAATPIGTPAGIGFAYNIARVLGIISDPSLLPAPGSLQRHETLGLIEGAIDSTQSHNLTGKLNWDVSDGVSLNLTGGYREIENLSTIDQDGTPAPFANASMPNKQSQYFAEAKLGGEGFGDRLDWVVGANLFEEEADIQVLTNPERASTRSNSLSFVRNQSYAAFGHVTYQVTDRLSVAGGARKTFDKRDLRSVVYRGATDTLANCRVSPALRVPGGCDAVASAEFDYISWEATAGYELAELVNVYARVAKGQKSGGFNASVQTGFLNPFDPETLLQYEAGVKADLFERKLQINASAYFGEYEDLQRQVVRIIAGAPSVFVSNAESARVNGAELEVSFRPIPNFLLTGGLGYTDAKYKVWEFIDPVINSREDLSNNDFALVPEFTYSVSGNYHMNVRDFDLNFVLTWAGSSSYFLSPENRADFKQKGFGLLSGRIALTPSNERWELAIFGNNLTNEVYDTFGSVYGLPGGALLVPVTGAPRMIGASATFRFR